MKDTKGFTLTKFFKSLFKPRVKTSNFELTIASLKSIKLSTYPNVYSSDLSTVRLYSACDGIVEYNKLLKLVIESLETKKVPRPSQIPTQTKELHLSMFFVHDGNYIDYKVALAEFIELSIKFIKQYKAIEHLPIRDAEDDIILRLTSILVSNITVIAKTITHI